MGGARGPFVMNTMEEILQAYRDYRQSEFGGGLTTDPTRY